MSAIAWHPAGFQRPSADGAVCTLCPFGCHLGPGDIGRCRVRRGGAHGAIETATFATSVEHLLPIERKPLYHIRPGRQVLTLAAPGCTFRCHYCQNFRISQFGRDAAAPWSARPVTPEAIVAAAQAAGADIGFSYAEPALAAEFTLALAPHARAAGLALVWKSNGFVTPAAARALAPALDAVCVDLKAADDDAHERLTGAPLGPILEALAVWRAAGVWVEIATPLIPGFNTDPAPLGRLIDCVGALGPDVPWHLLRFHPDYRLTDAPPTPPALLQSARARARAAGLHYVYVERALGPAARNTDCPACGHLGIERDIWRLAKNHLERGCCPSCGHAIPGHW